jgi:hypothetical protein
LKNTLITIKIKDSSKAEAFLNLIKSFDFITVTENKKSLDYPSMTDEEIVNRVEEANVQIKNEQTIAQEDFEKSVKNW